MAMVMANHLTTAEALPCFVEPKSIELFERFGVLSETEVRSRYEVKLEKYTKLLNIEVRTMKRMVLRQFIPAITAYATDVAQNINAVLQVSADAPVAQQKGLLNQLLEGLQAINECLEDLRAEHKRAQTIEDGQERANVYAAEIVPRMDALRRSVDAMEVLVDRKYWPMPTYNEMLFYV